MATIINDTKMTFAEKFNLLDEHDQEEVISLYRLKEMLIQQGLI